MRKKVREFVYGDGSDKYAEEANSAKNDAANNNFLQAAEDRINNARNHIKNMSGANATQAIQNTVNDSRQTSINTTINQSIQQASQAPSAAASATATAVNGAAQSNLPPARIAGTGAF
ncbi:hypothetical protein GVN19_26275 [Pseudomonas monteilii]|nr:hypothetical protein [Pseudomonas monteilii]